MVGESLVDRPEKEHKVALLDDDLMEVDVEVAERVVVVNSVHSPEKEDVMALQDDDLMEVDDEVAVAGLVAENTEVEKQVGMVDVVVQQEAAAVAGWEAIDIADLELLGFELEADSNCLAEE